MKNNAMAIGVRTRIIYGALAIMTIILSMGEHTMAQTKSTTVVRNIVIVHGGLVDGSGWEGVYNILKKDGCTVTIVQNPATTRRWRGWFMSLPLRSTKANLYPYSSRSHLLARLYRRSFLPSMAF